MKLRRLEGTSHEKAINMISLSPEQGGSGLLDQLADRWFDMSGRSSNVTDSNIKNYRNKLIQFMDDQLRGAIEEEDYDIRIEEGEVGPLERVGRAIGTLFGPIQDVLRDDIHPLASSGKRTGGRILPYTPKEPFDPSLMPEKLIWGVGKLKEPKVR